jgi:hypothetical protein
MAASGAAALISCRTCLFPQIILAPQHGPERLRGNVVWAQYGDFKQALATPPAILALHCSALKELLGFEVRRPLVQRCVHALAEILAHVSLEEVFALVARQRTACLIASVECILEVAERMPRVGGIGVALGCSIYSVTRTRLLVLGYSAQRAVSSGRHAPSPTNPGDTLTIRGMAETGSSY